MSSPVLLCVDDRPYALQLRMRALEPFGFSVLTASDIPSALAAMRRVNVDVVLVEYKNEGLDAEAVAFLIKQHFPQAPVILLSAYSDMPERSLWLVDDYVMKSDPVERVVDAVHRVRRPPYREDRDARMEAV